MDCIKHNVDQAFDIMVLSKQSVILYSKSTRNTASHRVRVKHHSFNF